MMLLFACGLVMLATAASLGAVSRETPEGELVVKAMSFIIPNTQPPSGVVTKVSGIVRMMQPKPGGETTMTVNLLNLPPNTPHGFHIHEFGDTFSQGCQSTGSHYNPFNMTHGGPLDKKRHVGDLGNLYSDERGIISTKIVDHLVSLVGEYSVLGRSFVIHQKIDDLGRGTGPARNESLKTGNAGPRLACGVIFYMPTN